MRMRYAALAATFVLAAAVAVTIILTSKAAEEPTSAAQQTEPHSLAAAPDTPVTPPAPDRCATPSDPTCIRAVYQGAPVDYAQVQDIPDSVLIHPDADGHYQVERGQQITVVTAARLPADYTPLLPPAPTAAGHRQSHVTRTPDPAGRDNLHLHDHDRRGCVQPDHLRPDRRPAAADLSPRGQATARRRRGHDQLPGPDPALRHPGHHRRSNHPRQLCLPQDRRGCSERDRQLRSLGFGNRRITHRSHRRERSIARGLLRHGPSR